MLTNPTVVKISNFPESGRAASLGMIIRDIDQETKIIGEKVRRGLVAEFTITRRHGGETLAFYVSRLVGERRWHVDAVWTVDKTGRLQYPHRNRPTGDREDALPLIDILAKPLNMAAPRTQWNLGAEKVTAGTRLEFLDNAKELDEMTGELDKVDEFDDFDEMDAKAEAEADAEELAELMQEQPKPAPTGRKPLPPVSETVFLF
ncbi:hypothetical protein [Streptomyces chartreusis]|uniref:Uncharacterized protein n=1 Tax=Streptomyces chartreusis TaxID=1969 RepID=A0A7H8TAF3_STRCX|nr:hypothetical protein [Streptomyces chartreusis]QKZ20387.1 hypothetical protein HUT05_25370 [Streptomyces chartreusis]